MFKPALQSNVFVDNQCSIMIDFVSISIMTYIFPYVFTTLSFANNISTRFLDREGI